MKKFMSLMLAVGMVGIFALALAGVSKFAQADHVACGDTIYTDTTLDEHLVNCTGIGITIGEKKLTLDLGGFTISGDPSAGLGVLINSNGKGSTVKNGTIEGFFHGVGVFNVKNVTLTHLSFVGQNDDSSAAVRFGDSTDVVIEHSQFVGQNINADEDGHPIAIAVRGSKNVTVNNVDVYGFQTGVNFFIDKNTGGTIKNSTFSNNRESVTISNSIGITVSGNHFSGSLPGVAFCCRTILVVGPNSNPGATPQDDVLEDIVIVNNHIHDGVRGIELRDTIGATVSGNHVHDNSSSGIGMRDNSTDNTITSNLAGNGIVVGTDLLHDASSTPNTWVNNSCDVSSGADITLANNPACKG